MKTIFPIELKEKLNDSNFILIDVREQWEYEEDRIADCLNLPLHDIPFRLQELEALKDKAIIVYCRSGKRGSQARKYLSLNGFSEVYNLEGGFEAYSSEFSSITL